MRHVAFQKIWETWQTSVTHLALSSYIGALCRALPKVSHCTCQTKGLYSLQRIIRRSYTVAGRPTKFLLVVEHNVWKPDLLRRYVKTINAIVLFRVPDQFVVQPLLLHAETTRHNIRLHRDDILYFYIAQRPPSNVYHRFDGRVYSILQLSIIPLHTSPKFYREPKSVKFGLDLRHHSSLSGPSFRNEATHSYKSTTFGAAMMELCSPQIWCSLAYPLQ